MKTDDLIAALAADTLPQPKVRAQVLRALPVGLAVSLLAFALFWGARPDLAAALSSLAVLKTLVPLATVGLAAALAMAQVHPATPRRLRGALLVAMLALVLLTLAVSLVQGGVSALVAALSTPSAAVCLLSIPVLAAPLLGALLWALTAGAATQPRLTGAVAGLMAGCLAAAIYSLYCDKDMVLFVIPAYSTAIALVVGAGAVLGPRWLKW
ncbi:NrsF family protein [Roseibaca sp. Y0-43]|uniref:NrsF family protein n=1 Tax=Roseibaca sp. Y0-43 TaxID=2816854 RepID=UPI001D0C1532|nr:NrsF family protein [Roseibaca sp. Y0-43]MCC1481172.1 DUF1109 domain-containing protein [Roseibaca sp. Y0-43]